MYRKNVAGQHYGFCLVNATTGAAVTGATVTVRRSIDGGAQATAAGTVAELGNGQYDFAPTAADLNGNQVGFLFTATGAIPHHVAIVATAADPTDAARFGLAALPSVGTLAVTPTLNATQSFNNTGQTTKLAATLASTDVTGNLAADLQTIKGQAVTASAGVTFPASIGTSTYAGGAVASVTNPVTVNAINGLAPPTNWNLMSLDGSGRVLLQPTQTGVTIPTVTTLANLPAVTTDWLTAAGVSAGAVTKLQSGLATPTNITAGIITTVGTVNALATDSVNAAALATDAVTEIQSGLATSSALTTVGVDLTTLLTRIPGTVQPQTGDAYARIGAAGAGLTALGDARLDNLDVAVGSRLPTTSYTAPDNATLAKIASTLVLVSGSTYRFTAGALALAPTGGGSLTPEAIADAILLRDWTAIVAVVPPRCLLNAARTLRNRWGVDRSGVLTIMAEDGTTAAFVADVAPAPGGAISATPRS